MWTCYLLDVLVKQGRSFTEGTASSISGYDLINVSISSGNWTDDLYSAAGPSPAHVPGLQKIKKQDISDLFLFKSCCKLLKVSHSVSPRPGNLFIRYWSPGRVAGPLLLKLPVKDFLYVVHVESTNCRAGDAAETLRVRKTENKPKKSLPRLQNLNTFTLKTLKYHQSHRALCCISDAESTQ